MSIIPGVGRFEGRLVVEVLPPCGEFVIVQQDLDYIDPDGRRWPIPAGLKSDGFSDPKAVRWKLGDPTSGRNLFPGLMHDARYRLGDCTKDEADSLLRSAARCVGFSDEDAEAAWLGVNLGGHVAWIANARKREACGDDLARLLAWA